MPKTPKSRIPSPARSQGAPVTPRRHRGRSSRSVGSPARSASGRLSSIVDKFKEDHKESFALSPLSKTVLSDNTEIEIPRRASWWRKVDNSRDVIEVLDAEKALNPVNVLEEFDVEVLSQEKKNYTMDLPDSSGSESISSIVVPQRKLFTQKENLPQKKFAQVIGNRESLAKHNKTTAEDKLEVAGTKNLFGQPSKRPKPVFPSALLNMSPDKTLANKTKELATEVKGQARSLFGNQMGTKRKNMFADFIVSESEDDISEIQPKLFAFNKNKQPVRRSSSVSRGNREPSPTSSMTTDIEMDDWKLLPSSTMVEHQLEANLVTPGKTARLSKLSEAKESTAATNSTKQSNKSITSKNKSKSQVVDEETPSKKQYDTRINSKLNLSAAKNASKTIADEDLKQASNVKNRTYSINRTATKTLSQSQNVEKTQTVEENQEAGIQEKPVTDNELPVEEEDEEIHLTYEENDPEEVIQHINNAEEIQLNDDGEDKILLKSVNIAESMIRRTEKASKNNTANNISQNKIQSEETNKVDSLEQQLADIVGQGVGTAFQTERPVQDKSVYLANKVVEESADSQALEDEESNKADNLEKSLNDNTEEREPCEEINDKDCSQEAATSLQNEVGTSKLEEQEVSNKNEQDSRDQQNESSAHEQDEESDQENAEATDQEAEISEERTEAEQELEQDDEEEQSDQEVDKEEQSEQEENDEEEQEPSEQEVENEEEQELSEQEVENEEEEQSEAEVENDEEEQEPSEQEVENEEEEEQEQSEQDVENSELEIDNQEENEQEQSEQNDEEEGNEDEVDAEIKKSQPIHEISQDNVDNQESEEPVEDIENASEDEEQNENEDDEIEIQNDSQEQDLSNNQDVSQEMDEEEVIEESEEVDHNAQEAEEAQEAEPVDTEDADKNITHDTTGRNRKKQQTNSPEAILHNRSNEMDSFLAKGRNTSIRKTILKNFSIRPSMAPLRESTGISDGTNNSSGQGSGWDSHRTTRKTLRQTFGKDFTPRKSLRALVMEKSAKQTMISDANKQMRLHQANSTEMEPMDNEDVDDFEENVDPVESDHEVSKRTRQATLEMYLQKIQRENMERKLQIEERVKNSLKPNPIRLDMLHLGMPKPAIRRANLKPQAANMKRKKPTIIAMEDLPPELMEDMKYKPPKRFRPSNASWITKRLYKFLESKLETKYDYKARVRAEKLVEDIYNFSRDLRKHKVAPPHSVTVLKKEMARLDIVRTHFEFYNFFHEYMPLEVKMKVVPDIVNDIPLPRDGIYAPILE